MSRHSYWDQILVVDGEVPDELLDRARECLVNSGDWQEGKVGGADPQDTKYDFIYDQSQDARFLFEYLKFIGIVPKPEGHEEACGLRYHIMSPGGKMAWHEDGDYSIAISVYLSTPYGGELQALKRGDSSQSVLLQPKRGRVVVMKCDTMHRVLEVRDDVRESIQIFITYYNKV